jgi:hypothetical protein
VITPRYCRPGSGLTIPFVAWTGIPPMGTSRDGQFTFGDRGRWRRCSGGGSGRTGIGRRYSVPGEVSLGVFVIWGMTDHDQIHPVLSATALTRQFEFSNSLKWDTTYEQIMFSPVQSRTVFQLELTHSRLVSCRRVTTGLTLKSCTSTLPSPFGARRGGTSRETMMMSSRIS